MSVNQILEQSFGHFTQQLAKTASGQQQVMAIIPQAYRSVCQVLRIEDGQIVIGVSSQPALYWLKMEQLQLSAQLSQQMNQQVEILFKQCVPSGC